MSKNNNNKTESTISSLNDVMDSFAQLKMVSDTLTHTRDITADTCSHHTPMALFTTNNSILIIYFSTA